MKDRAPRRCARHWFARLSPMSFLCHRTAERFFGPRNCPRRVKRPHYLCVRQNCTHRSNQGRTGSHRGTKNDKAAKRRPVIDPVVCHERKIWSGRRGSNPRPRPWQGRALPLSYTRIRDGGERSPSTADLCQMRTANATVRMRSDAAPVIQFHYQMAANRSETTPKLGTAAPLGPRREPRDQSPSVTRGDSSRSPWFRSPAGKRLRIEFCGQAAI